MWFVEPALSDWPHLRGPNYDGIATEIGLAESWPVEGPPRLWSRELGQGHSGFIAADGKIFTQYQTLGGQYLLCLDPDTGQTIWDTRYDWGWQPRGAYPGPYATPTWYRGKVYLTSPTGLVACVHANSGSIVWSLNVRDKFRGKGYGFGYAATPLVEEDRVVLPVGGPGASLVALHADDGRTVWTAGSDPASYCPALAISFQNRRCVIGYLENALLIVDFADGKVLYRQPLSSGYDEHSAWPLYKEPHLFLASPFRVPAARFQLQANADGSLLCRPQWTSRELCNDIISSVLYRNHVYGFDLKQLQASKHRPSRGAFKCLDWSTGKLRWSTNRVGQASVLVADDKLFLLNDSGCLIMAHANPAEYQELARTQLFEGEICWTPPMLSQGRLYARSLSEVVCVYVGRAQDFPVDKTQKRPPARPWRLDPTWLVSHEREYPNDAPSWEEMRDWFAGCVLLAFGGAALVTSLAWFSATTVLRRRLPGVYGTGIFLSAAFILGLLGPNLFSTLFDRCLFTWPASLYAAFHGAVFTCGWAENQHSRRHARWLARLAVLGFVLVGYGFFELCKAVGMFVAWTFLFGFLPAFPVTLLAVRTQMKGQRLWVRAVWTLLAFAAFFWSCKMLLLWKAAE